MRLDVYLTQNSLAPSRTKARALILSGAVLLNGNVCKKVSQEVFDKDIVSVGDSDLLKYVSRGGLKLEYALEAFRIDFTNANVFDIGSSTGGFTDCALQHGAKHVVSVDVGSDCMDSRIATDKRVELHEQMDIREAPAAWFQEIDYFVCDASFISLTKVLTPVVNNASNPTIIALIKPQFECGQLIAKKHKGVLQNPSLHVEVLTNVIEALLDLNLHVHKIAPSPISGGDGNREYVALLKTELADKHISTDEIESVVKRAFAVVSA